MHHQNLCKFLKHLTKWNTIYFFRTGIGTRSLLSPAAPTSLPPVTYVRWRSSWHGECYLFASRDGPNRPSELYYRIICSQCYDGGVGLIDLKPNPRNSCREQRMRAVIITFCIDTFYTLTVICPHLMRVLEYIIRPVIYSIQWYNLRVRLLLSHAK